MIKVKSKILFPLLLGSVFAIYSSLVAQDKTTDSKPYHNFEAGLALEYSNYGFDNINNHYISAFAEGYGFVDNHLSNQLISDFELGCRINKRITVYAGFSLVVQKVSGKSDYTYVEADDSGVVTHYSKGYLNNELNIDFISPYLRFKYRLYSLQRFDLSASISGGFSYGRAQVTSEIHLDNAPPGSSQFFASNSFYRSYSDYNFAFSGQLGITYKFNKEHSVIINGGYHDLSTDPLTDEYGNYWIVGGKGPQLNLDIKGWKIGLGYYYHFW